MTDDDCVMIKILDLLMRITLALERLSPPPPRKPEVTKVDDLEDDGDIWVAPGSGWE